MKIIRLCTVIILLSAGSRLTIVAKEPIRHFSQYDIDALERLIPLPENIHILEDGNSTFWKETIPSMMRNSYITLGTNISNCTWEQIPLSVFEEYKKNGNRRNYETIEEKHRRQMSALVIAEIMEGRHRFITDILRGLHFYMEEIWWGIPAHYPTAQPSAENQIVDLFNAETASIIAWTIYMLREPLEATEPGICEKMKTEIKRRLIKPAREINYDWKHRSSNWNPWICANWLACVLICENDRKKQLEAISQILQCMDFFYNKYPQDGGCEEGISYWNRAAGSLFECLQILYFITNGKIYFPDDAKLKAMARYVYSYYIGNQNFITFADSYANTLLQINIVYPYGKYIHDDTMMGFAAFYASVFNFDKTPAILFDNALGRELMFLSMYNSFKQQKPQEPFVQDLWLPDIQVFTARHTNEATNDLFIAAKGGHNGEIHNHNDVGNYIVYKNSEPLIIDIGAGTYTAQTFSNQRYELFNCRSSYHNVPLINGYEQHEGKEYKAKSVVYNKRGNEVIFSLDLSQTYPKEAFIKSWNRTIRLNRGQDIVITENYHLIKHLGNSKIILICCGDAKLNKRDNIVINNGKNQATLHFDSRMVSPTIEVITHEDKHILQAWKNKALYRIILTIRSKKTKGEITYSIK